jgi:hypothetical protein
MLNFIFPPFLILINFLQNLSSELIQRFFRATRSEPEPISLGKQAGRGRSRPVHLKHDRSFPDDLILAVGGPLVRQFGRGRERMLLGVVVAVQVREEVREEGDGRD